MLSSTSFRFTSLCAALLLFLSAPAAFGQESDSERSWDNPPSLINAKEVQRAIVEEYPADLRGRGIGGSVILWLFVGEHGSVLRTSVLDSSGHDSLDQAAFAVADVMRFDPATKDGKPKGLWVKQRIDFAVF